MGRGGDAGLAVSGSGRVLKRSPSLMDKLNQLAPGFAAKKKMREIHNDLTVLKNIWFKKLAETDDHAVRLEEFYKGQAHACELVAGCWLMLVFTSFFFVFLQQKYLVLCLFDI